MSLPLPPAANDASAAMGMARQAPPGTGWREWAAMLRSAVLAWIDDGAAGMGAALAYYTLFSLAPLLLIVVSVAGLAFGGDAARGQVMTTMQALVGAEGAAAVGQLLDSVKAPGAGVLASLAGVVLMLVGATSVFAELQSALDRIWRSPAPARSGLVALLRARLLSFGLILGIGFLLLVSLLLSAALTAVQTWWASAFDAWGGLLTVVNAATSFALVTAMFAMIYKLMPRVAIEWADVWVGAVVTATLFSVGRLLLGVYLGHAGVTSGFGAAGSLVLLLLWVYWSAQIFLLGAEFTWVYAHRLGSRRHLPVPAAVAPR